MARACEARARRLGQHLPFVPLEDQHEEEAKGLDMPGCGRHQVLLDLHLRPGADSGRLNRSQVSCTSTAEGDGADRRYDSCFIQIVAGPCQKSDLIHNRTNFEESRSIIRGGGAWCQLHGLALVECSQLEVKCMAPTVESTPEEQVNI